MGYREATAAHPHRPPCEVREPMPAYGKKRVEPAANRLQDNDRPVHGWYRFVLSFPPHLVRTYMDRFDVGDGRIVLDPFCGTGTTLVEAKKVGAGCLGIEANPLAHFASRVKLDWTPDPDGLEARAARIAEEATGCLGADGVTDEPPLFVADEARDGLRGLPPEADKLLLANSISPLPLHKALVLLDCLDSQAGPLFRDHLRLAFADSIVNASSNLRFGPEVGLGVVRSDAPVIAPWLVRVRRMADDLRRVAANGGAIATAHLGDAREVDRLLQSRVVDAVITSPPYPNEKDYTRTTRLESVLLGFIRDKASLRHFKHGLVRSNTRGVYRDDTDHAWVADDPEIRRISREIEERRIALGKTSGFERMYHRVVPLFFGGLARHLAGLRAVLRPGAQLAYVVGDQASYLRVMIRTGQLLASIAGRLGYEVVDVDLFRTRFATATAEELREEVVILRWRGTPS